MNFRRRSSRPALAALALGLTASAVGGAAAAQDNAYHGPMLSWAGKTQPQPPAEATPPAAPRDAAPRDAAPEATAPQAVASRFVAPEISAPEAAPLPPAAPAEQRTAYVAPPRQFAPPAEAAAPPPPVAAPARPAPVHRQAAAQQPVVRRSPPQPALRPVAPPAPPPQLAQAAPPPASDSTRVAPRFYSLHREYGLAPDPIAMPKDRGMVLVGPPDGDKTQTPDDAADDNGDGKSAQHGDGQGQAADGQPGDN